ncbi:hypothetical protein FE782_23520 [Paenibacillus antri]|uniref:Sporulation protein n=1 Tax=Paenibacillus antri TaxID=2582848 RepID=A0A5R9G003_9BACL|nr:hypothetical protein [Paenibacillus antri]TLS49647.1 hypothetical protein FE782_23520 [Paenibacillus antri]
MKSDRGTNRSIPLTMLLLSALLLVGGCGSEPNHMDANQYAEDGYLGMSNSNPNFRTNPSHHNYTKDRQLMRQALREMDLDKRSSILMSGTDVTVTIRMDNLTPADAAAIRSDAYLLLKGNVPRYDYHIRFE